MKTKNKEQKAKTVRRIPIIDTDRMIDYLEDSDPAIRYLAYINLMIA